MEASLMSPSLVHESDEPLSTELPQGARYMADYLTVKEELKLLSLIDAAPWLNDLKRRVQHYGYRYDYRSRNIDYSMFLGPLPAWAAYFAVELCKDGLMPTIADQVIVNEYLPGQGIAPHIDCTPCFEDAIVSISLGSSCIMNLINAAGTEQIDVPLAPRSVISLTEDSRYKWKHGIKSVKSDLIDNVRVERGRRVSLTFRKVKL
ncbi:alpha-ketoglutarate-dependent dioxygenase AlkB [Solirubrum puertoriconensis]|nr:alpha-ketoglutarate-dependent dioxygenase AlkB [Solirubrum puertoriconensis]